MKLKKIDTASKKFNKFRDTAGMVGYAGGCIAFDSLTLPWTVAIADGGIKNKLVRNAWKFAGCAGIFGMSRKAAEIAEDGIYWSIDTMVDAWNTFADIVNGDSPADAMDIDMVNDKVAEDGIFEFTSEKYAELAHGYLKHVAAKEGRATLGNLYYWREKDVYPELYRWGWTPEELNQASIDPIYILDDSVNNETPTKSGYILNLVRFHEVV